MDEHVFTEAERSLSAGTLLESSIFWRGDTLVARLVVRGSDDKVRTYGRVVRKSEDPALDRQRLVSLMEGLSEVAVAALVGEPAYV